jgi:hypothetical protein
MELLVDGRTVALQGIIDYAGLFPPASLDLDGAVAEYRSMRSGPHGWMLGRFLCPTSRLEDLAGVLTSTMTAGEHPWSVGAVFDGPPAVSALAAQVFERHLDPAAAIVFAEVRTPSEAADGRPTVAAAEVMAPLADVALGISPDVVPFLEIARTDRWREGIPNAVGAVARLREGRMRAMGAKLRTGGLTAGAFPTPEQVAAFIAACTAAGLPFKATAGLHHPVRHHDADLDVMRHGFLNLLVGTALAAEGAPTEDIVRAIADTDRAAFAASAAGLTWRNRSFGVRTLRSVRRELFPAYGSCSFTEPVDDLVAMGLVAP